MVSMNAQTRTRTGPGRMSLIVLLVALLLATNTALSQAADLDLVNSPNSGLSGTTVDATMSGVAPGTGGKTFAERRDDAGHCGLILADTSGNVQTSFQTAGFAEETEGIGFYASAADQNLTSDFTCFMFATSTHARLFPETGYWVANGFLRYWESYGGLAIFGYPLTDEYVDPATGQTVQYFERARFEWHPGVWPERYDVLLGRLGYELHPARQPDYPPYPFEFEPRSGQLDCRYFPNVFDPAIGFNVCNGFRAYWEQYGGLAVFGEPLSQEFVDPDTGVVVQWFERARFEWQPGTWPERYDVLVGRLGAARLAQE